MLFFAFFYTDLIEIIGTKRERERGRERGRERERERGRERGRERERERKVSGLCWGMLDQSVIKWLQSLESISMDRLTN